MSEKFKVFILDDHQMLIDGIKSLLINNNRYRVIGEETEGFKALEKIKILQPDIVISDINMPGMGGIEFTKRLRTWSKDIKICVLSMYSEKSVISEVIKSGANGYVLKNTGMHEFVEALDKIMNNQIYISNNIALNFIFNDEESEKQINKGSLTERELEILQLMAKELSNQQIANTLFISERTVETHRKNIFRKTQTKTLVGLMKYAMECKII